MVQFSFNRPLPSTTCETAVIFSSMMNVVEEESLSIITESCCQVVPTAVHSSMISVVEEESLSTITESWCQHGLPLGLLDSTSRSLCGRSKETLTLFHAYQNVLHNRGGALSKSVLVVHGESGSGKTSLVNMLRDPVSDSQGYFCAGKFVQPSRGVSLQEPHSAIMAAFSDLCDLVLQSGDFDNERRTEIQQALGTDANLLVKAISNLSPFLDGDSQLGRIDTKNEAVLVKFKVACKTFLHAMSSARHPIVLFIDDIQWMDEGSRPLIEMILHDDEMRNVMLILAYRDEEADSLVDIFRETTNVVDIAVTNLNARAVRQMISALLGSSSEAIGALSDLTVPRTLGNPFHVIHFIESDWIFDVDRIKRGFIVSETLLELLSRRIRHLDGAMQQVLKIASLFGYCFGEEILVRVASAELENMQLVGEFSEKPLIKRTSTELVQSLLAEAITEGFIERTKVGYKFTHDKLQASFHSMIEPTETRRLHFHIGNQFVVLCQDEDYMYHAAVHLNSAGEYIQDKERQDKLTCINLEAAKRCRDTFAFVKAVTFLRHGLKLLNEHEQDKWSRHFDLTFEMSEMLAKMELIIGNLDACKEINTELLLRSKSTEMKINSLVIDVEIRMAGNETEEAIAAAKQALQELGVKMPHRVTFVNLLVKLRKVRRLVGRKRDEDILVLPLMRDLTISTAVKLLVHLCMYCLMQGELVVSVYSALLATELTMKSGGSLSPYSSNCFTVYGIAEVGLGNIHRGVRFGELAMKLIDQIPCKEAECHTILFSQMLLLHWKTSFREMSPILVQALNSVFEVGDVVYVSACMVNCCYLRCTLGENLKSLEGFMRSTYSRMCDLGHGATTWWAAQPSMQFVLNMRSTPTDWKDLLILSGDSMDEEEFMQEVTETNQKMLLKLAWVYKALLAFHFGYFEMAATIYYEHLATKGVYFYSAAPQNFYGAMIFYERYRSTGQCKHLRRVRKHMKCLKRLEAFGSPNVSAYLVLLEAERQSLKSRDTATLVAAYNKAIDAIQAERFVHFEALANERLSVVLTQLGRRELAETCLDRAMHLFKYQWGAIAKYEWLRMKRSLPPVAPN